jgi:hypothetical protein
MSLSLFVADISQGLLYAVVFCSFLSLPSKFFLYIKLKTTASNSNLEILERFQSKVLRIITDAPWYIPNAIIKRDLQIPTVKQEARKYSANYRKRLTITT